MKKVEIGFWGLVIAFCITIIFYANVSNLDIKSSAVPVAAAISAIVFTLLHMIMDRKSIAQELRSGKNAKKQKLDYQKSIFLALSWLTVTIAVVYLFGFVIGTFVSSLIYFRAYVCKNWLKIVLLSLALTLSFYVLFVVLAGFRLSPGLVLESVY